MLDSLYTVFHRGSISQSSRGIYACHIRSQTAMEIFLTGVAAQARQGLNILRHLSENIYKSLCVSVKGIILLPQEHRYGFILQPEERDSSDSRVFVYQLAGARPKEIGVRIFQQVDQMSTLLYAEENGTVPSA